MDWCNTLIFGIIPTFTVVIVFFVKRNKLWIAPLISTVLAFITYMIALAPISIVKIFSNNEWRGFFILAMLMHLGIVVVLTVGGYIIEYILKRTQN